MPRSQPDRRAGRPRFPASYNAAGLFPESECTRPCRRSWRSDCGCRKGKGRNRRRTPNETAGDRDTGPAPRDWPGTSRYSFCRECGPRRRAPRLFSSLFPLDEPLGVLGLEIVIGVAEKRFCGGNKFRIGIAKAQDRAFLGRRSQGVHVGIIWKCCVRVIVVEGDAIDLLQQAVVDFLQVSAGQRPRLRLGHGGRRKGHEQSTAKVEEWFYFSRFHSSS